jgi:hypothetical protein
VTRGEKKGRGRPGPQPSTNLRPHVPPRFTGGATSGHDHKLGEGLEAEGLSGKNPIDTASVTTMTVMTREYRIFPMGGYNMTVPGYWRTFRKTEQDSKENWRWRASWKAYSLRRKLVRR